MAAQLALALGLQGAHFGPVGGERIALVWIGGAALRALAPRLWWEPWPGDRSGHELDAGPDAPGVAEAIGAAGVLTSWDTRSEGRWVTADVRDESAAALVERLRALGLDARTPRVGDPVSDWEGGTARVEAIGAGVVVLRGPRGGVGTVHRAELLPLEARGAWWMGHCEALRSAGVR